MQQPIDAPDVWDVLIVGGGPAGTAAAFRLKELGIQALVIELDEIMKRIRDYDQSKPIKPDFGAGKQMSFPKGGNLVDQLHFYEDVQGTVLVDRWAKLYFEHSIPVRTQTEFLGLELRPDGAWSVQVRNHNTSSDEQFAARHVILALGAGMPRRIDVPGNVRSIATKLTNPSQYQDQPVCVLGGGTSAAEAVIAISQAKAESGKGDVYWSHRGRKMPAVSHALAEELFRATTVRGNVRYLPGSEARAVVSDKDGHDWLRVETDRRLLGDRPPETTNLEFDVGYCIACIGQEIDKRLLADVGVHFVVGGQQSRKGLPLTKLMETRQPNVYVIGDTLNAAYLECDAFDDSPSNYREVKHRGNIKGSLTDGVRVAEAVAQKVAGQKDIAVHVTFAQAAERAAAETRVEEPTAVLTSLIEGAVEAEQYPLHTEGATTLGRSKCDINFPDDQAVAEHHASIVPVGEQFILRSENDRHEVFLSLTEGRSGTLGPGTMVKAGEQWLVFGDSDAPLTVDHHDSQGHHLKRYDLQEGTTVLGRDTPGISIAPEDKSLSRRHALISVAQGKISLRDLNSVNGLYVRVAGSTPLLDGDLVRLGHQALRFTTLTPEPQSLDVKVDTLSTHLDRPSAPPTTPPPAAEASDDAASSSAGAPALPEGLLVAFQPSGKVCPFKPDEALCDIAQAGAVALSTECKKGICGEDPVRVIAGAENLNPKSEEEEQTLSSLRGLEGPQYRLACVARATGPVVVEVME